MSDFIQLTCPSCGGALKITNEIERFACSYCGVEQIVRRSGGIVSLAPVLHKLDKIQNSSDRTASELAIPRIKQEIIQASAYLDELRYHNPFFIVLTGCISLIGLIIALSLMFSTVKPFLSMLFGLSGIGWVFIPPVAYYLLRIGKRKQRKQWEIYLYFKNQELAKHYQVVQHR